MSDSSPERKTVTACVLIIGNEILSGRTKDANLAFLAEQLNLSGVRLMEARVIPDVPQTIIDTVNAVRGQFDYVFTTGGIGPTHDDITSECVAAAFGLPLIRNPEAVRRLQAHYPPGGLNEARLRMANTPEGAELIDNPVSIAPGFRIGNVFVLAGVPAIMRAMFESLRHSLTGGLPMQSRTVTSTLPEGAMAAELSAIQDRFAEVEIGSYPFFRMGKPGTAIVLRATDVARLALATDDVKAMMTGLGDSPVETDAE
ncbi:molybdenum cofactor synthesis domain-containing protein [Stella humosa]|uniref:Molybdenum cofactor synthesis domain-containing protein n=1 Tax=Stella humosa TaxID=94 RepID=A0A3N1M8D4_9PROT|nr:molybdopterin-binding protein [Stella humosa]ROP99972.1 molybdenum cofactor synthesis domain-containing protein [Stella humosa]BBK30797.1 molybdenum cofactor biosynthesis protein [Stella humosa]